MLVLQQIKVLPAGARIVITDEGKKQLSFTKAIYDDSLIFEKNHDALAYYNMFQNFKCVKLEAYYIESLLDVVYEIEIRG